MTTLDNLLTERQKNPKIIQSSSHINPKKLLKGNNFKIFLQLNKTESPIYYYGALQNHYKRFLAKDQLLIIENLKMNLLSKSCITPGIISLLYNLIILLLLEIYIFHTEYLLYILLSIQAYFFQTYYFL